MVKVMIITIWIMNRKHEAEVEHNLAWANYNQDDPDDHNHDHDKYDDHVFRRVKLRAQLGLRRRCNGRVGGETLATELDLLILILTIWSWEGWSWWWWSKWWLSRWWSRNSGNRAGSPDFVRDHLILGRMIMMMKSIDWNRLIWPKNHWSNKKKLSRSMEVAYLGQNSFSNSKLLAPHTTNMLSK